MSAHSQPPLLQVRDFSLEFRTRSGTCLLYTSDAADE